MAWPTHFADRSGRSCSAHHFRNAARISANGVGPTRGERIAQSARKDSKSAVFTIPIHTMNPSVQQHGSDCPKAGEMGSDCGIDRDSVSTRYHSLWERSSEMGDIMQGYRLYARACTRACVREDPRINRSRPIPPRNNLGKLGGNRSHDRSHLRDIAPRSRIIPATPSHGRGKGTTKALVDEWSLMFQGAEVLRKWTVRTTIVARNRHARFQ